MRSHIVRTAAVAGLLSCLVLATAMAEDTAAGAAGNQPNASRGMLDSTEDPQNALSQIRERSDEKDSLFRASPIAGFRDRTTQWKDAVHKKHGLKLAVAFNTVFQGLSKALPGEDKSGVASTLSIYNTLELVNRGKPNQGQIYVQVEGRWDYGTTGPNQLGPAGLGSLILTANTYAAYTPTFLPFRNLYWQQGSTEAGWVYRVGKITPDQTLGTSKHLSPATTFLPAGGTGPFSIALPDSGLGMMGTWYVSDRFGLMALFSDANANRQNLGDLDAGDYFKAIELGGKIAPRTPKAGFSKLTLWHTDGTEDGQPINGMTGVSGWGYLLKLEQELTADGRSIGLLRYGRSYDDSAVWRHQAGVHWLLYDPHFIGRIRNDLMGVAFNWIEPVAGVRDEYNMEVFYRFPMVPNVDTTFSYQAVIDPALDLGIDFASALSFRIRVTF